MKFRLIQRKRGWVVQRSQIHADLMPAQSACPSATTGKWQDIWTWPFRFLARLHLLVLREWKS